MKRKALVFLLFFAALVPTARAAAFTYDYNPRCRQAYQHFLALRLPEGRELINAEIKQHPNNLLAIYLSDYEDCLELLFNGDPKEYAKRKDHMAPRMDMLVRGDESSPWYLFCKSGLNMHWALVHIRFGEKLRAATLFRKSFLQTKENNQAFPDFAPNKVFMGLQETVIGTLPDDYSWVASLFGMKGSVRSGMSKLAGFINNASPDAPLRAEAVIYYCYLRFYLMSQQAEVWNFVNSAQFPTQNNLMHSFVRANIGLNFRKGEAAMEVLKKAQSDPNYSHYPILDYEYGSALLHKLDNTAVSYLYRFATRAKGNFFVKDAWQKMAQSYYIQRNKAKADMCLKQILRYGTKDVDADRQAQRFAEAAVWPDPILLQSRLLIDGGYYNQAHSMLTAVPADKYKTVPDRLEYSFRLGRVYDELGNENKALQYYQQTINLGRNRKEHFAARSALQMAMIYEKAGKTKEAVNRYKECLTMDNHDFQSNIDQQAKAGVNRLTQE